MPLQLRQLRCCTAPVSSRGHRCAPQSQSGGGHLDSSDVVSVLCLLTLQGIRATSGTGCNASRLDAVVGPKTSAMTPPCILGRVGYRCATHTGRKPSALPGPSQQWRALPGHPAQSPLPPCTTVPHDVRQRATSARISAEQVAMSACAQQCLALSYGHPWLLRRASALRTYLPTASCSIGQGSGDPAPACANSRGAQPAEAGSGCCAHSSRESQQRP